MAGIERIMNIAHQMGRENFALAKKFYKSVLRESGPDAKRGIQELVSFAKGDATHASARLVLNNAEAVECSQKLGEYLTGSVYGKLGIPEMASDAIKGTRDGLAKAESLMPKTFGPNSKTTFWIDLHKAPENRRASLVAYTRVGDKTIGQANFDGVVDSAGKKFKASIMHEELNANGEIAYIASNSPISEGTEVLEDALKYTRRLGKSAIDVKPLKLDENTVVQGDLTAPNKLLDYLAKQLKFDSFNELWKSII